MYFMKLVAIERKILLGFLLTLVVSLARFSVG
jgi:hypothetical protein